MAQCRSTPVRPLRRIRGSCTCVRCPTKYRSCGVHSAVWRPSPTGERSPARTSGTTPSSVHQATGGVQRVTSPQKAASSMKHSGGEDSEDEKWFSGDEDDGSVSCTHTKDHSQSRRKLSKSSRSFPKSASRSVHRCVAVFGRAHRTCLPVSGGNC